MENEKTTNIIHTMFQFLLASVLAFNQSVSDDNIDIRPRELELNSSIQKDDFDLIEDFTISDTKIIKKSQNPDGDLFVGKNDLCPNVPGREYGCPKISLRKPVLSKNWTLEIQSKKFEAKEQKEVAVGDELFVGFEDKKTKKIFPIGQRIKVQQ